MWWREAPVRRGSVWRAPAELQSWVEVLWVVPDVLLSFKAARVLIQVVGQVAVVDGAGGFQLKVGHLPKPPPDRVIDWQVLL